MSTLGERKCALLLVSLDRRERRRLLARLPTASARTIQTLIAELEALSLPIAELAEELLVDEVRGLTARTSLDLDQLIGLSQRLPPIWFARVLSVWTGVDREFCLAILDRSVAIEVRRELERVGRLPPKLVDALRAETAALVVVKEAA
jgi:hypothetical protein